MEVKVNEESGFLKEDDFKKLHEKAREEAISLFNKRATMGSKEKIEQHREALESSIEEERCRYDEENKTRDPAAFLAVYIVRFAKESDSVGSVDDRRDCVLREVAAVNDVQLVVRYVPYDERFLLLLGGLRWER